MSKRRAFDVKEESTRMKSTQRLLGLGLFCLSAPAIAQSGATQDLVNIYDLATRNDQQIAAAQQQMYAGKEYLPQGRALLLPSVGVDANFSYNNLDADPHGNGGIPRSIPIVLNSPAGPLSGMVNLPSNLINQGGRDQWNSWGAGINIIQPLYNRQSIARFQQSKIQAAQAETDYENAKQYLMLRVAQAYFNILLAQDNIAFAQAQMATLKEDYERAKTSFEVGTATIVDQDEALARYDQARADEIAARNALQIAKDQLAQLIGQLPANLARLSDPERFPLHPPIPDDITHWENLAQEGNFNYILAQQNIGIAKEQVAFAKGERHPTLDFVGRYAYADADGGQQGIGAETKLGTVGVQFNMPIYAGGAISSRIRQAIDLFEASRHQLEDARRGAILQAQTAFLNVTNGLSRVQALRQALESSQVALDSTRLGFEVGVRTNVDVLNAESIVYNNRRALADATYRYLQDTLQMKYAIGALIPGDMEAINRLLSAR
jgi:outer membrane protein